MSQTRTASSSSTAAPVRLGVVGAGQISQIVLPMLAGSDLVVAGLADLNQEAAQAQAAKLGGVPVYPDPAALLAAPDIEAVYIATPPATHGALVEAALSAGKHVLCEKPWTLDAAEARSLAETVRRFPGLRVGCCSSRFCFSPTSRAARALMAEGALGRLRRVRIFSTGGPPSGVDRMPAWKRSIATAGGGMAIDWGVYELEWLRFVLGAAFDPCEVSATLDYWRHEGTDLESGYHAVIRCASGLEVILTRQPEIGPSRADVELRGETAGLDVPFATGAGRLHRLQADGKSIETVECCEPTTGWSEILSGPIVDLARSVRTGTEPSATADGQILVHSVLDAIYTAARERRVVAIALSGQSAI